MEERKIAVFLADFDHQVAVIARIYGIIDGRQITLSKAPVSSEVVESCGYWIHNLYCAYEDLFKIVSAFWENGIDSDGSFHRSLIRRMILEIKGIRPALISEKTFRHLDELRGFRHVFRHAYNYGMDDERVLQLVRAVQAEKDNIFKDIKKFRKRVTSLVEP